MEPQAQPESKAAAYPVAWRRGKPADALKSAFQTPPGWPFRCPKTKEQKVNNFVGLLVFWGEAYEK